MDRQLVLRARAGDREAYELIVLERGEHLYRTALAILGRDADARDATQEALISGWRRLGDLREPDRFDAWIGRILVNECRMALRRRGRVREIPLDADSSLRGNELRAAELEATDSPDGTFDDAFDRLSAEQRTILVLHHMHGYGVKEIAAWLGVPAGTVKWRLSRARAALRAQLGSER